MSSIEEQYGEPASLSSRNTFLLYDGECPFCSVYTRKSLFETRGGRPLTLIDANRVPDLVAELRREGYDIDVGMILVLEGRRHQGVAAMMAFKTMTGGTDWFNRFARWLSSNPKRVRILYPWFRRLRGVALWMKGNSKRSRIGRD